MDEVLVDNFMVFDDLVERGALRPLGGRRGLGPRPLPAREPGAQAGAVRLDDRLRRLGADARRRRARGVPDRRLQRRDGRARRAVPALRDRAVFVGDPADVVDRPLGPDLPAVRDWAEAHFDFVRLGDATGRPRRRRAARVRRRRPLCVVSVGGSGVGAPPAAPGGRGVPEARRAHPRPADGRRGRPADRPGVARRARRRRGARLPARPRPAPRRVRRRGRPGRAEHHDGADRARPAVPVRSRSATTSSSRCTCGTGSSGTATARARGRGRRARGVAGGDRRRARRSRSTTGRWRPTGPRGPPRGWPS